MKVVPVTEKIKSNHLSCYGHVMQRDELRVLFLCDRRANEQTDHLMVSDNRRPWTPATPEVSQVRCRPFKGFGPPVTSLTRRNTEQTLFHAGFHNNKSL